MPLRDHFRPPVSSASSWEELHGGWPMKICEQLNESLPLRFVAKPQVHLGAFVEVDVAAFENDGDASESARSVDRDGTALWTPSQATATLESEMEAPAEYEIRIYDTDRNRTLVAAIELVSPANKDRPEHRRAFISKCVAMLWKEVSVTIVDPVTIRTPNLFRSIWEEVGGLAPSTGDAVTYAVSIKPNVTNGRLRINTWEEAMNVGQTLPTLPLWLSQSLSVELDLESSYEATCRALRIR